MARSREVQYSLRLRSVDSRRSYYFSWEGAGGDGEVAADEGWGSDETMETEGVVVVLRRASDSCRSCWTEGGLLETAGARRTLMAAMPRLVVAGGEGGRLRLAWKMSGERRTRGGEALEGEGERRWSGRGSSSSASTFRLSLSLATTQVGG
jgi:hypothetical protein